MPKAKRVRTPRQAKQGKNSDEAEAEAVVESEVPSEVAEDLIEERNNESGDAEGEEVQGADVVETPRKRSRKRRRQSNQGKPVLTPDSKQNEGKEIKIAGMIFMCNDVTKKDCFKYGVFGFPEQRKDLVDQVKRGMKLFLFDISQKHLYGIYEASSRGGTELVPEAFRESDRKFPAQVRFRIFKDCVPLKESEFKQAIKDNYDHGNRFRSELSPEQVRNLMRLFRPLEGLPQPRNIRDAQREPVSRDVRKGPSRYAHTRGSARHISRPAPLEHARNVFRAVPPEPVRDPLYPREFTSLYARERPPVDLDYYHMQPSYISAASQIARAEAEGRQRYLDDLYLEQTNLIARRPPLYDPLYIGAGYQRELPYVGYPSSGLLH